MGGQEPEYCVCHIEVSSLSRILEGSKPGSKLSALAVQPVLSKAIGLIFVGLMARLELVLKRYAVPRKREKTLLMFASWVWGWGDHLNVEGKRGPYGFTAVGDHCPLNLAQGGRIGEDRLSSGTIISASII